MVWEHKGRNDTGEGRDQLGQVYKGSRNGRTDLTLGLNSTRLIGDLDKSSLDGTGRESLAGWGQK